MRQPTPRRVLFPLGLGTALSLLGDSTLYTVLPDPDIAAQIGVSLGAVGLLLGANRLVRLAFNPLAGSLYDRFPRRWLLIASMGIGTVSTALYSLSSGVAWVLAGRVLWGAAWAGIWVGAHAMILDIADESNRGRINGLYQVWFFIGIAGTALAGGAFTDLVGLRSTLWLATGVTGLVTLFWIGVLPETRPPAAPDEKRHRASREGYPWREALPAAVPYFAVRLATAGVLAATTILWLGRFFETGFAIGRLTIPLATFTGMFVAIRTLISLAGAPLAGAVSDRLRRRWGVISVALAVGAAGLAGMNLDRFLWAGLGALLVALSGPGIQALAPAIIGDRLSVQRRSRGLGVVFSLGDLGSAIGPPLAFALIPSWGLQAVYFGAGAILLTGAFFSAVQAAGEVPLTHDQGARLPAGDRAVEVVEE